MESGEISSEQISASSQYNSNWSPERSRLNYQENGWTPSDDTVREWIQVGPGCTRWVLILLRLKSRRTAPHFRVWAPRSLDAVPHLQLDCTAENLLTSGLNIVHSFVHLPCTLEGHRRKKWANMHYLLICLSSTVDISHLHCKIWHSSQLSVEVSSTSLNLNKYIHRVTGSPLQGLPCDSSGVLLVPDFPTWQDRRSVRLQLFNRPDSLMKHVLNTIEN